MVAGHIVGRLISWRQLAAPVARQGAKASVVGNRRKRQLLGTGGRSHLQPPQGQMVIVGVLHREG